MLTDRFCRRCLLLQSGRRDTLEQIKHYIGKIPAAERTDEAEYAARLAVCTDCDHLVGGSCMKCGCYVELRAAYRLQHCPLPASRGRAW